MIHYDVVGAGGGKKVLGFITFNIFNIRSNITIPHFAQQMGDKGGTNAIGHQDEE